MIAYSLLLAILLDYLLGEAKKYHPLVGFGGWASVIESQLNKQAGKPHKKSRAYWQRLYGVVAYIIVVVPMLGLALSLDVIVKQSQWVYFLSSSVILYFCIGWKSLLLHAKAVSEPLKKGEIKEARQALAMIVSRDTAELQEREIAGAATESVLENGADAIFSAVFWFCLLGIPGVVLYRMSNTLDAMWGYKNTRYIYFGWFAARVDDGLNFIPARLCALSYALLGRFSEALRCWRKQAASWKSPNAGPVMAAGAGALNVSLGGAAMYHGRRQQRPRLGPEESPATLPSAGSIEQACHLVNRSLVFWCVLIVLLSGFL